MISQSSFKSILNSTENYLPDKLIPESLFFESIKLLSDWTLLGVPEISLTCMKSDGSREEVKIS